MRINVLLAMVLPALAATSQVSDEQLKSLKVQGAAEGWTFDVGRTSATDRGLHTLQGLKIPENWRETATFKDFGTKGELPSYFNWQDVVGMPPIRDQGQCNSCWAFAMVGTMETNILVKDGTVVNLSEQWVVSCNQETTPPVLPNNDPTPSWGCNGGWLDFDYFSGAKTDACGGSGAVYETDFPYVATKVPCNCPHPHPYMIDSWAFIGPELGEASVDAIKQAIVERGPVASALYAGVAFSGYRSGVFNASTTNAPNHSVVIIGWDDSLGTSGAWRIRNGWGANWGEAGYMWIAYGVSHIGYGACYIDYPGATPVDGPTITKQPVGAAVAEGYVHAFSVEADGLGLVQYEWFKDGDSLGVYTPELWVNQVSPDDVGSYVCHVTDVNGTVLTNAAMLTIDPTAELPVGNHGVLALLVACCLAAAAFVMIRVARST